MAIDFLILFLLIISFVVNLLAFGAFWVTPGLRTTANRFTINLLVVNLIGCLILAPTLFLCGDRVDKSTHTDGHATSAATATTTTTTTKTITTTATSIINNKNNDGQKNSFELNANNANNIDNDDDDDSIEISSSIRVQRHDNESEGSSSTRNQLKSIENDNNNDDDDDDGNSIERIQTIVKSNSTFYQELTIDESRDSVIITAIEEQKEEENDDPMKHRKSNKIDIQNEERINNIDESIEYPLQDPFKLFNSLHLNGFAGMGIGTGSIRCWTIDLVAALGALAVLLVVGDTWCAVTDPLRYHTRISAVRTWIFIALIWAIGIFFGALSALREVDFEAASEEDELATSMLSKQRRFIAAYTRTYLGSVFGTNSLFGMAFACLYFVVIILLPFGFVCGMYWRIFSEARENGLRMRQNGSSPLLQSALNLTHHQQQQQQQQLNQQQQQQLNQQHRNSVSSTSSHGGCGVVGGLQLQIDTQLRYSNNKNRDSPACLRRDSAAKVLLPTISDDGNSEEATSPAATTNQNHQLVDVPENDDTNSLSHHHMNMNNNRNGSIVDRHLNILLTLQSASGEIKRNYSARQLPLLGTSSQDLTDAERLPGMRQVHSSPNLAGGDDHHSNNDDSLSDDGCSPHLLGPDSTMGHHHHHHQQQQQEQQHHNQGRFHHRSQQQQQRFQMLQHHRSLPHSSSNSNNSSTHPPMRHHHHLQHHQHALQIPAIHASPKALSYMTSLRHRLSNASSLFKYREESRAARISILVVIMFLVSYLPYGFLVLLQSRLPAANFAHSTQLAIFMIAMGTITSPVIFAYRNQRVRRGVKRLFGREWRGSEHTLQRQGSGGIKHGGGSGSFIGNNNNNNNNNNSNAAAATASNIRRNGSKLSTYSSSSMSGKYLTPQTSLISANGATPPPPLRPNSSCSTIINFGKSHTIEDETESDDMMMPPPPPTPSLMNRSSITPMTANGVGNPGRPRPILQRGITIVEQIPLATKFSAKHNIFKLFFQSSRNLGCAAAAAQSCTQSGRGDPEPAEV